MWLVAGLAGQSTGVLVRVNLGKVFGFGGTGRMAAHAEDRSVQFGWQNRGVVGVLGQGTVAGFAVYVCVLTALLHLQNVGVAGLTGVVAGEVNRAGGDLRAAPR